MSPMTNARTGVAFLGDLQFRVNPSQVYWEYNVDAAVTPTVGGRVVQVYGATLGDMTIQGLYGEQRIPGNHKESWQLAEEFADGVGRLITKQSVRPTLQQLAGTDPTPMHPTVRFYYDDDTPERRAAKLPLHHWDFNVYVKALKDVESPGATVTHATGKFSYGYQLTLFVVEDNTGKLAQVAQDDFIARLSDGLGWKRSPYQGHMTVGDLESYLKKESPDGTIHGLVLNRFTDAAGSGGQGLGTSTGQSGSGLGGP